MQGLGKGTRLRVLGKRSERKRRELRSEGKNVCVLKNTYGGVISEGLARVEPCAEPRREAAEQQ